MEPQILIIEDEAIIALDIARMVKKFGYSVAGIADGMEEALLLAGEKKPSLALVDIKLNGSADGIEIAKMLAGKYAVPVVFITAYSDEGITARAMQVHPAGFLHKPLNKSDFEATLKAILG